MRQPLLNVYIKMSYKSVRWRIDAMLWISNAMAFHGRHLEEAPPAIAEEPDSEEPPQNRSEEIIESIRICRMGGVTV